MWLEAISSFDNAFFLLFFRSEDSGWYYCEVKQIHPITGNEITKLKLSPVLIIIQPDDSSYYSIDEKYKGKQDEGTDTSLLEKVTIYYKNRRSFT